MAVKREIFFDTLYGGQDDANKEEMLDGNKDLLTKNIDNNENPDVKLKENKQLKAENDLEINGNGYHISF